VLVEMEMTDDTWHLVKSTPKVTGFVGGTANRPAPISEKEVDKILRQVQEGVEKPRPRCCSRWARPVRVKDGPFTDFNGNVEEVNYEKSKLPRVGDHLRSCHAGRARVRQVEKAEAWMRAGHPPVDGAALGKCRYASRGA
jgi:transcription antitermination factor NusG